MHLLLSSTVQFSAPVEDDTGVPFGRGTTYWRSGVGLYTRTATARVNPLSNDLDVPLKDALTKFPTASSRDQNRWSISVEVGVNFQSGFYINDEFPENVRDNIRVRDTFPGGVLENLSNFFGGNVKIKAQILGLGECKNKNGYIMMPATVTNLETTEEKVVSISNYGTWGYQVPLASNALGNNNWHFPLANYQATLVITVTLPIYDYDTSIQDVLCINRKMLKDEVSCDVTIIPKNQVPIKCHKSFLCAHSTVLDAMFQTQMKESKTSTVEMPDMSEQSVRAFLEYLYLWEVKRPNRSSLIAFELLHAGHKYDIKKLEESMEKILLSKDSTLYDVDVALKLFLFARNRPEGAKLKMKSIQVLKARFAELEKSRSYHQLFQRDAKAAMELCKYAFSA